MTNQFDFTLKKYTGKSESTENQEKPIVEYLEEWTSHYRQMDCNRNPDYSSLRSMSSDERFEQLELRII